MVSRIEWIYYQYSTITLILRILMILTWSSKLTYMIHLTRLTVHTLSNLCVYFKAIHTCHSKLRYFDWDGQVHLTKGKTGGQQGDPLEMLIFNLTTHHLCGQVLAKFQEARVITYNDDGYIKDKLSVDLRSWLNSRSFSKKMLVWSSMSLRDPSSRLRALRRRMCWCSTQHHCCQLRIDTPQSGNRPWLLLPWRFRWYRCVYWHGYICT